jgi:hypothetical protein
MAITDRAAEAYGGPKGGSTWYDEGMAGQVGFTKTAATVSSTTLEEINFLVPTANVIVQPGDLYLDTLGTTDVIQGLYGTWIVPLANWAANIANLTVRMMLRRGSAGAIVGGGAYAGWAAASNPALTAFVPIFVPFLTTNTALLPGRLGGTVGTALGGAYLPLQQGDVLTTQFVTTASVTLSSLLQVAHQII